MAALQNGMIVCLVCLDTNKIVSCDQTGRLFANTSRKLLLGQRTRLDILFDVRKKSPGFGLKSLLYSEWVSVPTDGRRFQLANQKKISNNEIIVLSGESLTMSSMIPQSPSKPTIYASLGGDDHELVFDPTNPSGSRFAVLYREGFFSANSVEEGINSSEKSPVSERIDSTPETDSKSDSKSESAPSYSIHHEKPNGAAEKPNKTEEKSVTFSDTNQNKTAHHTHSESHLVTCRDSKDEEAEDPNGSSKSKYPKNLKNQKLASLRNESKKSVKGLKAQSMSSIKHDQHSLSTPDVNLLLLCACQRIQGLIVSSKEKELVLLDIFDERKNPLVKGAILNDPPGVEEVYTYFSSIFKAMDLNFECAIVGLAYIERLIELTKMTLHCTNWRRLGLSVLILAAEVWEDLAVWNADFKHLFRDLTVHDLNLLERYLLNYLSFNVTVRASLYAKYYFELREMTPADAIKNFIPLNKEKAQKLEEQSKTHEDETRKRWHSVSYEPNKH
eukprot:TRINITY_DN9586_c0_g1_i1.p1 TRINITY_DN9586_c0_g1~~TRINITY_DN9586_c0_g1_i1.p1  ORF type:complete len:501 (+),score=119.72 TRINITY_DN9586_c0_g1_i1:33-1535(+)